MSKCDAVLVARTVKSDAMKYTLDLSWMKLINEDNYEQAKTDLKVVVPGYFDGDYGQFDAKRNLLQQQEWYSKKENLVRTQYLALTPAEAIAAWRDCTIASGGGAVLVGYMREVTDTQAVLHLEWGPVEGTVGRLHKTRLQVQGATITNDADAFITSWVEDLAKDGFVGSAKVMLTRQGADVPIVVTASGRVAAGSFYSVSLEYEPPAPPPEIQLFRDRKDFGAANGALVVDAEPTRDRLLDIDVQYQSNYETPGDPYFGLRVVVDGAQEFYRREGSQRPIGQGFDVISTRFQRKLKAGQSMKIAVDIESYNSKAHSVRIEVNELKQ